MSFISDLLIEISSFRIRVGNKLNALANRIGDLTTLTTTNKNSLVEAVNEVNGKTSALDDFGGRNYLQEINTRFYTPYYQGDYSRGILTATRVSASVPTYVITTDGLNNVDFLKGLFTFSGYVKINSAIPSAINISGSLNTQGGNTIFKSYDPVTGFFVATHNYIGNTVWFTHTNFFTGYINQGDILTIENAKFEKGSIYTDWTPAPEDQVSDWNESDSTKYSFIKNKPTLVNNYLDSIITTNGTTAGTVYTFKRVGLSDLNITLTPASASFSGVVTTGAQTFAGNKTVTGLWTYRGTNATPITIERTNSTNTNIRYINQGSSIYAGATNGFGGGVSNVFAIGELADLNAVPSRWVWFDSTGRVYSKNDGDSGKWDQAYQGFLTLGSYVLQSSLNAQLNNYATKAGTQTFTGTNTFTQAIYIPAATLAGHAVNLGQMQAYVTGLGYTTMSAVQTWVNSQNYATSASIGNGTVVLQGLGYLSGTATFSMNQSGNTVGSFDLTQTAKNYIGLGTEAYSKFAGYFGGVERYFHNHDVQSEGSYVDASQNIHTFVTTTNMGTNSVDISTHVIDGAELVIQGNSGGMTTFYLPWMDPDGNTYNQIDMEMGAQRFFWIEKEGVWKIV